jgi:hypothetical protein
MTKIQSFILKAFTVFFLLVLQNPASSQTSNSTTSVVTNNYPITAITFVTIAVSILSLSISAAVAYSSNFRRADIKLSVGRNIIFFSVPSSMRPGASNSLSGVGFYIPITFYNWSPRGGAIYRLRLIISREGTADYYDMAWTTFVRIASGGSFEDENLAQPIPVEGRSSVNKIIRFDWNPEEGGQAFDTQSSVYKLRIYGWLGDTEKPSLEYKKSFTLKKEPHYKIYEESINKNASLPIIIPIDENEKSNQVLLENSIDKLYSSKK